MLILGILVSIIAVVVPTTIWCLVIWWCDRYEREPLGLLVVAFFWGAVPAVVISLIAELVLDIPLNALAGGQMANLLGSGAIAPAVEEVTKGVALLGLFLLARREFDDVLDGIVYGALVGFGFGMTENAVYFITILVHQGWGGWAAIVILRGLVFGLNHAFFTGITGAGLGIARVVRRPVVRWTVPPLALLLAIGFHAVHNLGASLVSITALTLFVSLLADWGGILLLMMIVLLAWRQEQRWITTQLADEVGTVLTAEEYEALTSYGHRVRVWRRAIGRGGWARARAVAHFHHLATELAFRKQRLQTHGGNRVLRAEITHLRQQLQAQREKL
ncbi:MAG TPA: PrsW family intramembrane metalloprotease [Anaerolineae bacterium]|nr:PrsW family intramembrane metalloprotease [Anaerolineae bacterium]